MEHTIPITDKMKELFRSKTVNVQWNGQYDQWNGTVTFYDGLNIESVSATVWTGGRLYTIGAFSNISSTLHVELAIGRYSSIGHEVQEMQPNHPLDRFTTNSFTTIPKAAYIDPNPAMLESKFEPVEWQPSRPPIQIGNDVWVGQGVILKPGIKIGDGAVIAQNAIVTKDVPPYAIVGGIPAKVIRYRFEPDVIIKLLELNWWDYSIWDFEGIRGDEEIHSFIEKVEDLIQNGKLVKYDSPSITAQDLLNLQQ